MRVALAKTGTRKCNDCQTDYNPRQGYGGGMAYDGDDRFVYDGLTGLSENNPGWFHGAYCSSRCYAAAYAE